jgi:hypothetical protein
MNMAVDRSASVDECPGAMHEDRERSRWRAVVGLLLGDREDVDQEGLLNGRTLVAPPPRFHRDADGGAAHERRTLDARRS